MSRMLARGRRGQRGRIVLLFALALASVAALVLPAPQRADAHPLGNFTTNRYARLELYRDAIQVQYVLDFAEIPTFQLLDAIDRDGDDNASPAELERYARAVPEQVARNLELRAGDNLLALRPSSAQGELLPGQGGLQVLRVAMVFTADAPSSAGVTVIRFADRNYDDRAGWKEIVVRPTEGARATVEAPLTRDLSNELRAYPDGSMSSGRDVRAVSFEWDTGTGAIAPDAPELSRADRSRAPNDRFAALLERDQSLSVVLFAVVAAFAFGAVHALGPGHGKAMVAAYLVGTRGRPRDAAALGLTVTATHTSSVYALGFVTIAASAFIVPERLYIYLGIASGVGVLAMGLGLFTTRVRRLRRAAAEADKHRHGLFRRSHSHAPAHNDDHAHDDAREHHHAAADGHAHSHEQADGGHGHRHAHASEGRAATSTRGLLLLGVMGGLVPCPSALLVMLAAISIGQVLYGMLLIVAFSTGLAAVLTGVGLALVLGRRASQRLPKLELLRAPAALRAASILPAASALVIAGAGALITLNALQQAGL